MLGDNLDFLLNVKEQILGFVGLTAIMMLDTRNELLIVAEMTLCKREFKERKKGRSIVQFLLLTNFKDVIPKLMFFWYYAQFFWLLIGTTIIAVMSYIGFSEKRIINYTMILMAIPALQSFIYELLFLKHDQIHGLTRRFPRRHVMTQKHTQPKRNSNRPKKNTKPKERSKESQSSKQE